MAGAGGAAPAFSFRGKKEEQANFGENIRLRIEIFFIEPLDARLPFDGCGRAQKLVQPAP